MTPIPAMKIIRHRHLGDETEFNTITIGTQYHFNKKTRLNMEYSSRDNSSDTTIIENQNKGVGGRFAIQVTAIF